MKRKTNERIGNKLGIIELKNHPWLKDYPWEKLLRRELIAPFQPNKNGENFDKNFCNNEEELGNTTKEKYNNYYAEEEFNNKFINFTFIREDENTKTLLINDSFKLNKQLPTINRDVYSNNQNPRNSHAKLNLLQLNQRGYSNSIRVKDFSEINFKKVLNNKATNDGINPATSKKILEKTERNASMKAIRDNRLLNQLNDFKLIEDKTDIRNNNYEGTKFPKLFESNRIQIIKNKIKQLGTSTTNQISTTVQGFIYTGNPVKVLTNGIISVNSNKKLNNKNERNSHNILIESPVKYSNNTLLDTIGKSNTTKFYLNINKNSNLNLNDINELSSSKDLSNKSPLHFDRTKPVRNKPSMKNLVYDTRLVIEKVNNIEKGIIVSPSAKKLITKRKLLKY